MSGQSVTAGCTGSGSASGWQFSFIATARSAGFYPTGILTGWGLLFIWRLSPTYGMRQTIWLILGAAVLILGIRTPKVINYLQRYKYLWLVGSLILTLPVSYTHLRAHETRH